MNHTEIQKRIYSVTELIKNTFGFKDATCSYPDDNKMMRVGVTYNGEDWKNELIHIDETDEGILSKFQNSLFTNKWDDAYTLHANTLIVENIISLYFTDCYYVIDRNMLCKIQYHVETDGEVAECIEIVDLSTVKYLSYSVDKYGDISILKFITDNGDYRRGYRITQDDYSFEESRYFDECDFEY